MEGVRIEPPAPRSSPMWVEPVLGTSNAGTAPTAASARTPKAGETVVISAASGAVGSVAGQLAKQAGTRVVGVAGGPDKCLWVQEALGFDACIDHRVGNLDNALREECPNGSHLPLIGS